MIASVEGICNQLGELIVHPSRTKGPRYRYGYWMKHNLPFNSVIDDNNIVELQDEWLYNEPAFFANTTDDSVGSDSDSDTDREALMTTVTHFKNVRLLINVPERKPQKGKRPVGSLQVRYFPEDREEEFKETADIPRRAKSAKKRFWAFVSRKAKDN
ncbi:hypothetical protein SGCOL_000112 [Colletotrichum sp. CLE4]